MLPMYDQALFLQIMQLHHARPCRLYLCESNLSSPAAALHLEGLIVVSDMGTCSVTKNSVAKTSVTKTSVAMP